MENSKTGKAAELADRLRHEGVAEIDIDYLLGMYPSRFLSTLNDFLVVIVMIAGFSVGAILWVIGAEQSNVTAREHARSASGVLYEDVFGISGLIAVFGWICASGYIVTRPGFASERLIASAFAYSMIKAKKYAAPWRSAYFKADKNVNPRERFADVVAAQGAWGKWPAIVLLIGSLFMFDHEMKWFTIYTQDRIIERSQFGLGKWVETLWADAVIVELGCNHVTGKSASDDPVYKITFQDGRTLRLDNARGVNGSWLDGIEVIDRALSDAGAEFRRWSWRDRNPLHPNCLAANRRKLSEVDYDRLRRILRVDPDRSN